MLLLAYDAQPVSCVKQGHNIRRYNFAVALKFKWIINHCSSRLVSFPYVDDARGLRPRIHEQKNSKISNGLIRYVKQTEILTHATHVNGREAAVRIFLLMYTGSMRGGPVRGVCCVSVTC